MSSNSLRETKGCASARMRNSCGSCAGFVRLSLLRLMESDSDVSFCTTVVEALAPRLRAVNCKVTVKPGGFFEQTLQTNFAPVTPSLQAKS